MKSICEVFTSGRLISRIACLILAGILFAAPLMAQRPAQPTTKPPQREAPPKPVDPILDNLLAADSYKLYGEVRNVGQLLTTGGAGDIVEPLIKFVGQQQLESVVKFLKSNSEALATSRLLFASWPARTDVPNFFVAIEFENAQEAAKFSPKLETFLPTMLPTPTPTPPEAEAKPSDSAQAKQNEPEKQTNRSAPTSSAAKPNATPQPALPFVIKHGGSLVFISDRPFKFEKLLPAASKPLAEDANFRVARDRFSAESIFLFFNIELEDKTRPPAPVISEEEKARMRAESDAREQAKEARAQQEIEKEVQKARAEEAANPPKSEATATLTVVEAPRPTTPKTEKEPALTNASRQAGQMLELIGIGEPQWPDAIGVALVQENNEYVIRAILIEPSDRQRLLIPVVPQLISGQAYTSQAPSVLPADTEVFVSASIDLSRTYEGMRKQAETRAKNDARKAQASGKEPPVDAFTEFERKAGFKIKDDLMPALGNELVVAGSLKTLQGAGMFGPTAPASKPSPEKGDAKSESELKGSDVYPVLLIAVKDRDAARRLLPRVLDGFGVGEANLVAQTEKRDDAEIVNYAGLFAYAFVGNFLVISEAATVRRVVDAAVNHETLSGNNSYKASTQWESRQALGQVYVSPALMEQYREQLNKQAPKLDPALRDLVMRLSPLPQAITYSLNNEGFGALHELHLPKDLVVATVAGTAAAMSAIKEGSPDTNEMIAIAGMGMIANAQNSYRSGPGKGSYGTIEQLTKEQMFMPDIFSKYGYKIDVTVIGDGFEAVATPLEYGKTGSRSFFVDKSGVVRGDDHGGGPATSGDKPIQ